MRAQSLRRAWRASTSFVLALAPPGDATLTRPRRTPSLAGTGIGQALQAPREADLAAVIREFDDWEIYEQPGRVRIAIERVPPSSVFDATPFENLTHGVVNLGPPHAV